MIVSLIDKKNLIVIQCFSGKKILQHEDKMEMKTENWKLVRWIAHWVMVAAKQVVV